MLSLLRVFGRSNRKANHPRPARAKRPVRGQRRWGFESLEDRQLLAVITVDDDLAQKPNADHTSISAAVAAASPGDTIRVYRGTYNESVLVNKTLNLQGDNRRAVVEPPAGLNGFNVQANNVVIQGFTVQNATDNAGIYTSPAFSGYKVLNNLIRNNTFGLYLNSSPARESFVAGNSFENNNVPGAASGNGIYADQGTQKVRIDGNLFRGHVNAGIIFADADTTQSDIRIRSNQSIDDTTFVALFNAHHVTIEQNLVRDTTTADDADQGSKIFVGGDTNDVLVRRNTILGGGFDGVAIRDTLGDPGGTSGVWVTDNVIRGVARDGVSVTAAAVGAARISNNHISEVGENGILLSGATGNLVSRNHIQRSGQDGISLDSSNDNTISDNHLDRNGRDGIHLSFSMGNLVSRNNIQRSGRDGISLEDADNNTLEKNLSERNVRDGIRLDIDSEDNLIDDNRSNKNGEHDCHDDSLGTGTAGTANTWTRNRGKTENRTGLCRR